MAILPPAKAPCATDSRPWSIKAWYEMPGMRLEVAQFLSLPGDPAKTNEDAFGHGETAAVVIDGATPLGKGLMPGPSDAAWIAQFGARRLMAHLQGGDGARRALRAALADTRKSFEALRRHAPEEMW